jgi:ABC-type multidrug transport system ATPase subunit
LNQKITIFSYGLIGPSGCGKTTLVSCILGMHHLDQGYIEVLGSENAPNKTLKASRRIGYMPQEMALVSELTVKETIYYFGNIFEMESTKLKKRYKMLRELLELPPDDLEIGNCSGGEQRRVSFAVTIVHEPDLLILDEPTVGIDVVLRERIWEFLWNLTRTTKLSVIITTHYIDEAQKADIVGLMRNGVLLTQDTPKNIMDRSGTDRLEEAFVEFCMSSELQAHKENSTKSSKEFSQINHSSKRKLFRWQIISAVFLKYVAQFKRQSG